MTSALYLAESGLPGEILVSELAIIQYKQGIQWYIYTYIDR